MKLLLTCLMMLALSIQVSASEYLSFEGLSIGQNASEVAEVVSARGGLRVKPFPLPDAIPTMAAVIGVPADSIEIKVVADATSSLEPAVAMVAFDKGTGSAIWLSLYPRWLGYGNFGQRMIGEQLMKKYGIDEFYSEMCETNMCLVGQAPTGEIITITSTSNVRVYAPPH